jgi:hypothetical protein
MLYEASTKLAAQWYPISITGDPDDPMRSPRVDIEWARQQIKEYGRDNPWVMSFILGKFPPQSVNSLLGPDEVDLAMRRRLRPEAYSWSQKRLGVDCARFGDDRTCIYPRQGLFVGHPIELRKRAATRSPRASGREDEVGQRNGARRRHRRVGRRHDRRAAARRRDGDPCQLLERPTDPHFFNIRSEMHWKLAQAVKAGSGCRARRSRRSS